MAIEIGSLVVRGTFGRPQERPDDSADRIADQMQRLRREILDDVREMMDDAERRSRER